MAKAEPPNPNSQNHASGDDKEGATNRSPREGHLKPRVEADMNAFSLEDSYPVAADVFLPFRMGDIAKGDAIIVLDTSTLLLPYNIRQDDLTALQDVYNLLSEQNRLKIPARAAREFIKNRDNKLADMLHALNEQKSRLQIPNKRLSPLLEAVPGHNDLVKAQESLSESRKIYEKLLTEVIDQLRKWRGDDPVTKLYKDVFKKDNIVDLDIPRQDLVREWDYRSYNKKPPGYKDSAKDDSGIGDFLIWKTILAIGEKEKKDCVFVTGDEKPDWFVRSNKESVYARPELIDEYRRASEGKVIELVGLADLLRAMEVKSTTVQEVRSAEEAAASIALIRLSNDSEPASQNSLRAKELMFLTRKIFPGRERSKIVHWQAFRDELVLAGYTRLQEVELDMIDGKGGFLAEEAADNGQMYFTDVGAARGAIVVSRPDLSETIGSITPDADEWSIGD